MCNQTNKKKVLFLLNKYHKNNNKYKINNNTDIILYKEQFK